MNNQKLAFVITLFFIVIFLILLYNNTTVVEGFSGSFKLKIINGAHISNGPYNLSLHTNVYKNDTKVGSFTSKGEGAPHCIVETINASINDVIRFEVFIIGQSNVAADYYLHVVDRLSCVLINTSGDIHSIVGVPINIITLTDYVTNGDCDNC